MILMFFNRSRRGQARGTGDKGRGAFRGGAAAGATRRQTAPLAGLSAAEPRGRDRGRREGLF